MADHRKLANGNVLVFPRRHIPPTPTAHMCRDCGQPATHVVLPRIDHRRRKPWPQSYWLCTNHAQAAT